VGLCGKMHVSSQFGVVHVIFNIVGGIEAKRHYRFHPYLLIALTTLYIPMMDELSLVIGTAS